MFFIYFLSLEELGNEQISSNEKIWLKKLKSRLEESELRAAKEREANKELEEEMLLYKKKVVE